MRITVIALFVVASLQLSACGQKGPLYLPEAPTPPASNEAQEPEPTTY